MKEEFLHYIFKNRFWSNQDLKLTNGKSLEIIDTGQHNYDSGPDFFNSKIKIDNTIWVGNIEIHINSSDWLKHKHHHDEAYSNVILHVVFNHDCTICYKNNIPIPVWEINFPQAIFNKYAELQNNNIDIPCANYIDMVDEYIVNMWLERVGIERLLYKSEIINTYLTKSNNDWEFSFYVSLCRSFGGDLNSFPFEQLAFATPLKLIRKYSNDIFKLEALLFGQSGLLENVIIDDYTSKLQKEYNYLRHLHNLNPISKKYWKMSKLRPSNFPQIKIAQLVGVLQNYQGLFSKIILESDKKTLYSYFKIEVSPYWKNHYVFGKYVESTKSGLGKLSIETILINTIAPFIFKYYKDEVRSSKESHYKLLTDIKPENNRHIRMWKELSFNPQNAFETQALLHLKKQYCDKKDCLKCHIGHNIMKQISLCE